MRLKLVALASLALLAACTTPSQRITAKLSDLGVPPHQAQCMGQKLGSRLTMGQLKRLDSISRINGGRFDKMRIDQIARALDDPRDPGIVAEVIRAGVGCLF
jgi:hypothetical protein